MDNIRLAQALVPIADELDERGLAEEAAILDEYIAELMSEASSDDEMVKEAQQSNLQQAWQGKPYSGGVAATPGALVGGVLDTPGAAVSDLLNKAKQGLRGWAGGAAGQVANAQENIAMIDQQIRQYENMVAQLRQQKLALMQEGQALRKQQGMGTSPGTNVQDYAKYINKMNQMNNRV